MSYFSIYFVYLYYPMKFERKFLKGPPLFWKIRPPPAEKKIGPPPLGFWSSPTYDPNPDITFCFCLYYLWNVVYDCVFQFQSKCAFFFVLTVIWAFNSHLYRCLSDSFWEIQLGDLNPWKIPKVVSLLFPSRCTLWHLYFWFSMPVL